MVSLPSPLNLSGLWNFGSLLVICLAVQLVTGVLVSIHYVRRVNESFARVVHLIRDVEYGWLMRGVHSNGASFFFICMYVHVCRGLYYGSYRFFHT